MKARERFRKATEFEWYVYGVCGKVNGKIWININLYWGTVEKIGN